MGDIEIRRVPDADLRAAATLFRGAVHYAPPTEQEWEWVADSYEPGRTWGAYADGRLVGTTMAWSSDLVVPGGRVCPMAAVTRVGVSSDFRRRGVLRRLMTAQLRECAERGELFAGLRATEPGIYGRFGYGVASRFVKYAFDARQTSLRPEVPSGGEVRMLDISVPEAVPAVVSAIYERVGRGRVGTMARPPQWWRLNYDRPFRAGEFLRVAVHRGPDGDDGFVAYRTTAGSPGEGARVSVEDVVSASQEVANALWRYVLGIDLVAELVLWARPVDEPVPAMLVDPRGITATEIRTDLWVRLVDVPAALAARTYGPGSVVVEVDDPVLPANSGRYRVGADGAVRTEEPAEIAVDLEVLSMLYLGGWRAGALAGIGRVRERVPGAAARADVVFGTAGEPWSGTFF
ncbi:GNAT family N-acetyltransferase [Actinokineospora auranticolor]|uniref:Putative acetyltransferase n=1 Tax=Actinokineospora auranticolor TaxID=155976 RepID=A0A2S6H0N5_9PSEU|nr:GNAT family N-acetyltransferase [Actinokineospora auranticolor]PPK71045.1 putative acetyltransferase [Actinokineospora auranticolor]